MDPSLVYIQIDLKVFHNFIETKHKTIMMKCYQCNQCTGQNLSARSGHLDVLALCLDQAGQHALRKTFSQATGSAFSP